MDFVHERKKKQPSSSIVPYLCKEIILLILNRVPFEALFKYCRLVCKLWYNITYQLLRPSPARLLIQNPKAGNSVYFVEFNKRRDQVIGLKDLNLDFVEFHDLKVQGGLIRDLNLDSFGTIRGTCNGLILVQRFIDGRRNSVLHVLNPLTRQCISLPPSDFTPLTNWFGIAFIPSTREFKVVQAFENQRKFRCEILTLGSSRSDGKWRTITMPFPKFFRYSTEVELVLVSGIFHLKTGGRSFLISIDVGNETLHTTKLPNGRIVVKNSHFIEMGGCLGLIERYFYQINVWVLKDFSTGRWTKLHSIIISHPWTLTSLNIYNDRLIPIASLRNGKVIIFRKFHDYRSELYSLDIIKHVMKKIEVEITDDMACLPYTAAAFSLPGADDDKNGESKDQEQV